MPKPTSRPTREPSTSSGPELALTVVVVSYRPGPSLQTFLDTLRKATTFPYRVLVVDNDASDPQPATVAAAYDEAEFVSSGGNVGFGRAANIGAARVDTEWLVVANPDVAWSPGSLDALLAARDRWPRAGALGPAILTPEGSLYPSARALPSLGRGVGHALLGWWWPANPWTQSYRRERGAPVEGPVGWLSGSCLVLRREAFEGVHGFDPAYFMYFEDLDLCERLGDAGWLNVYVPDAVVTHVGGEATSQRRDEMVAEHHRSAYRYLSRRYAGPRWLPVRLGLRAGLAGRQKLSTLVRGVGEGARPTRDADVLDD